MSFADAYGRNSGGYSSITRSGYGGTGGGYSGANGGGRGDGGGYGGGYQSSNLFSSPQEYDNNFQVLNLINNFWF